MENYVGKRLDGRYEIQDVIGVGGMAVVYKAYDNVDDRMVAIKILKEEFTGNEEFLRRFKNESKAIAVLSQVVADMKLSIMAINGRIDKNHDAILEASISLADISEVDLLIKKMQADIRTPWRKLPLKKQK